LTSAVIYRYLHLWRHFWCRTKVLCHCNRWQTRSINEFRKSTYET